MAEFPDFFRVQQHFPSERIGDVEAAVNAELERVRLHERIRSGQSVAIAVGSRGIANLRKIVTAVVRYCKAVGAEPFIVPAMGSHGGATAEGQAAVLARYGITPEQVDCPVMSQIETDILGHSPEGIPIHFDRLARAADHVIVCNRVKPHTRFVGEVESGLLKMLLIGLGKPGGATVYHQAIQNHSFGQIIRSVTGEVLRQCPITLGVAIVENAYDETARIEAVLPEAFQSREPELLKIARDSMPRLPFDQADLLIVDRIGKDISGAGMDTNVVGRKFNDKVAAPDEYPKIRHLYVRGLTPATAGNATGIGIAEFCRSCVVDEMDAQATWVNCVIGGHVTAAQVPMHFPTDAQVLEVALSQAGLTPPPEVRWMWIPDTLHLSEVLCSRAYWDSARQRDDLEVLGPPEPLRFDTAGQLEEAFLANGH